MFTLEQVVPWGRSFDEYCAMFSLSKSDMAGRILGCGDGLASINATATRAGARVISCDPIYTFGEAEIEARIAATYGHVSDQARQNQKEFVWEVIPSVEDLAYWCWSLVQASVIAIDAPAAGAPMAGRGVAATGGHRPGTSQQHRLDRRRHLCPHRPDRRRRWHVRGLRGAAEGWIVVPRGALGP